MRHLVIVGAGVIGLSCAWAAQKAGWRVTIVDRDPEGDRASHGNAGALAVGDCIPLDIADKGLRPLCWLLDPLGPLSIRPSHAPKLLPWLLALRKASQPQHRRHIAQALAALNNRALADTKAMLADLDLSHELREPGALVVYGSERAYQRDAADWALRRVLGVSWRSVSPLDIRVLEPALAPVFARGVLLADGAHVRDPKRLLQAMTERLCRRGAEWVAGEATRLDLSQAGQASAVLADGRHMTGDRVLVAAGAWSAPLASSLGERVLLESERGYNTTLPAIADLLQREVVFAERNFVATPLDIGLRVGGAAEFAGLDAAPNYRRSDALLTLARRYLPGLDGRGAVPWMGQRPATPDSLPVIGPSAVSPSVGYAFGHGHLGLTQAATTGVLVASWLQDGAPPLDLSPYAIGRFRRSPAT